MGNKLLKAFDLFGLIIIAAALVASPYIKPEWDKYYKAALIIGGLFVIVGLAAKYREIIQALRRRSTLLSVNSFASVAIVLVILGLGNYIALHHDKRVDMTKAKAYSLSDQTLKVLQNLNRKVQIKAFFPGGDYPPVKDLLVEYRAHSPNINFEFIDPDKQPQLAKNYKVQVYGTFTNPRSGMTYLFGTLVLESDGKIEKVEKQQEEVREEDLTNALIKLLKTKTKAIYFLTGHGEKSIDDSDRAGYSVAKEAMGKERYEVKALNLVQEKKIPDDCAALVIGGPTTEPFPEEIKQINEYLGRGGSALILLDPPPGGAGLKELLKSWNIDVGDNIVIDLVGRMFTGGPEIPVVTHYGRHRITEKFGNIMTFFPLARSITPAKEDNREIRVEKLLETSPRPYSWAETDYKQREVRFDEGKDIPGPVSIGVVATKDLPPSPSGDEKKAEEAEKARKARLVVVGDSDFASNAYFVQQGNGNLFLNMINWLAQDESFISIRTRNPEDRRIFLSESRGRMVKYISLIVIPISLLFLGIVVWAKRRG